MMMTGDMRRWPNETNGMSGVVRVFDPYMYRSIMYRDGMSEEEFSAIMVRQLEETILLENPNDIAAMFLETVIGMTITNALFIPVYTKSKCKANANIAINIHQQLIVSIINI
jgi:taurine--2-oxoglutarate transaminase